MFHNVEEENSQSFTFIERTCTKNTDLKGLVVNSEDAAYDLYNNYGHGMGFSVRKGKNIYLAGTKVIRSKDFYCSKQGFKEFEGVEDTKKHNKLETRTGCPAMIRYTVQDDQWTVTRFISEHNHELATPSKRHLLRSARSIPSTKANVIDSMVNAGIRPKDVYSYMSNEVGGVENVGFTRRDCYNYVNKQKMMMIEAGDGQSLLNHFKVKASEDPMFFYTVQVDQENRLTNFFWRDDETAATFFWLFKSFLQSMGNQAPKTIMTDQDHAINKAIEEIFPNSCHRLCLWHISKNAPSHLGSLNANVEFHGLFHKCMQGCESELEFEETWAKMINDHNLQDHSWLEGLYKCRKKWSTAFSVDIFSSQIKSSQRAEVTNNVLHGISKATTSLTEFIFEFENLVRRWRSSEAEKDFQCKNGSITCAIKGSSILTHASKVYTHEIYKRFQKEFLDGIPLTWREVAQNDKIYTFEVMMDENSSRVRTVQFNATTMEIHCTCKKFDFCGYLCSHALRILSVKNIKQISERYISRRWTKDAKKNMHGGNVSEFLQEHNAEAEIVFRNRMIRFAYELITKSQENEKTRKLCQKILYEGDTEVEKEFAKLCISKNYELKENETSSEGVVRSKILRRSIIQELSGGDDVIVEDVQNRSSSILNPPCVRPKGISNARLKGHLEKRKSKKSKLPKPKKKVAIEEQSNVHVGSTQSYEHFVTPSIMMPPVSIYAHPYPNTIQFFNTLLFLVTSGIWALILREDYYYL
ncbi:hypothetical protein GQ457_01G027040 [Hibiscus cannabinus]